MSIVTKTGDAGATSLMFNCRVSKAHPRVEACGDVDELNAALGLARSTAFHRFVHETVLGIQKDLILLMGELATAVGDLPRYVQSGFQLVEPAMTRKLEAVIAEIEAQKIEMKGWATPGSSLHATALDLARTVCRRAERRVCALHDNGQLHNGEIIIFLNRLGDLLWLLARWVEAQA